MQTLRTSSTRRDSASSSLVGGYPSAPFSPSSDSEALARPKYAGEGGSKLSLCLPLALEDLSCKVEELELSSAHLSARLMSSSIGDGGKDGKGCGAESTLEDIRDMGLDQRYGCNNVPKEGMSGYL